MSNEKVFVASDVSKAKAKQLRLFALLAWFVAIAAQIFAVFKLITNETLVWLIVVIVVYFPEINLILMDIKMPIMDGNEAMKKMKKRRPNIPIIALTAFAMESDRREALEIGFDAYLTKPIDKKLLFEIIGKYAK